MHVSLQDGREGKGHKNHIVADPTDAVVDVGGGRGQLFQLRADRNPPTIHPDESGKSVNCGAEQNQKRKIETSNTARNRGAAKARDYQLGSMDRMILLLHTCR